MHPLSAREVVEIWEQGRALHPVDRALLVLGYACPDRTRDELATLPLGERDAYLLELHAQTFGPSLTGFSTCAYCGEHLEFVLGTGELLIHPSGPERPLLWEWSFGEYVFRFRLPNSLDLAAITGFSDSRQARRHLFERCVSEIRRNDEAVGLAELPQELLERLSARMGECDPQADLQVVVRCLSCRVESEFVFDIAAFFWEEAYAFARRLLREVHVLARAYGWNETEILSLGPARRELYLEMVGS